MNRRFKNIILEAFHEDFADGDVTTNLIVPATQRSTAVIRIKNEAIVCGLDIAREVFRILDPRLKFRALCQDGDRVRANTVVAEVKGKTRALLSGERVALNFLGYLSGVATSTNNYTRQVKPYKAKILDTRKTTPGLRIMERWAVRCGGGVNHRPHLKAMVMIKDNHLVACGDRSLVEVVQSIKRRTHKIVILEVDDLVQFRQALPSGADIILLDNMPIKNLKEAVRLTRRLPEDRRPLLEASGGINLKNVRAVAATGVDRISIGALTHTRCSIDVSMEFIG